MLLWKMLLWKIARHLGSVAALVLPLHHSPPLCPVPAIHGHAHLDGHAHEHEHVHTHAHTHVHAAEAAGNMTPWVLFTIFVFGPCEPLIPLVMYPAAKGDSAGVALVAGAFGLRDPTARCGPKPSARRDERILLSAPDRRAMESLPLAPTQSSCDRGVSGCFAS